MFFVLFPTVTQALAFSTFTEKMKAILMPDKVATSSADQTTFQNLALIKPVIVDESITDGTQSDELESDALSVVTGSLRFSTEDIDFPMNDEISVYEVKKGDTLVTIAKLFGVSKNTIIWANDLKSEFVSPGTTLVILPMTGIKHTVKKGDSLNSIARKYKADREDIAKFNGITENSLLEAGDIILVPEGEIAATTVNKKQGKVAGTSKLSKTYSFTASPGFLIRPISGGRKTQGLHGNNGVDLASSQGTPVYASAAGRVVVARMGGYNGGYGNFIILIHEGGIQTVYAHLRNVYISPGTTVMQGQTIGEVGNTGRSTGPHLHFEVRGAKNPF